MNEHYDSKSGIFTDRRKVNQSDSMLIELKAQVGMIQDSVNQRLDDSEKIVQNQIQHLDRIIEQLRSDNLAQHRDFIEDNRQQHKELIQSFEKSQSELMNNLKGRLDEHDIRFDENDKNYTELKKAIEDIKIAPVIKASDKWKKVGEMAIVAIATLIITGVIATGKVLMEQGVNATKTTIQSNTELK